MSDERNTLADERRNRFKRNDEVRAANREAQAKADLDARIARREDDRAAWVGDKRSGGMKTISGITLDPVTAKLKAASDLSRQRPAAPTAQAMSRADVEAITAAWADSQPELYVSDFNATNMKNAILEQVMNHGATFGTALLDAVYRFLDDNNYLERQFTTPRSRGDATRPAPQIYPEFQTEAQRNEQESEESEEARLQHRRDITAALALPFAELQERVRKNNPRYASKVVAP